MSQHQAHERGHRGCATDVRLPASHVCTPSSGSPAGGRSHDPTRIEHTSATVYRSTHHSRAAASSSCQRIRIVTLTRLRGLMRVVDRGRDTAAMCDPTGVVIDAKLALFDGGGRR